MKFDVLHNFISPVTGRVLADFNYVLVGNKNGIAIPSPALIDLRLDLINLRKRYNTLITADFVVGHANKELPNAQVLANLTDGFLYNTEGIVSTTPTTPKLPLCYAASTANLIATYNNGTAGMGATLTNAAAFAPFSIDGQTPPVNSTILIKNQISSFQNGIYFLSNTGSGAVAWVLTRSPLYDQPEEIQPGDIVAVQYGTVNSSSLWIQTQIVNVIGTDSILFISINLFNFLPKDNIWIGSATNRPVPNPRIGFNNLPTFLSSNSIDNYGIYNLYTGQLLGLADADEAAQPTATLRIDKSNTPNLSVGKMWIGTRNYAPPTILINDIPPYVHVTGNLNWDPFGISDDSHGVIDEVGLAPKELFIGNTDPTKVNQISKTIVLYIDNMANLTFNRVWRGNGLSRPVESDDLTLLELKVTNIEDVLIPGIETEIAAIEAEIVGLQAEIAELQTQIVGLAAAIAVIQGQIAIINTTLANLKLNNIPADADVSVYNFKIINLANATNPLDAVNLQTLNTALAGYLPIGSIVPLSSGGTNANLTASNGGIFYSTATAGAILAGTATANQILLSGSNAAPSWSTATYPSTTTVSQLLYSSATNVVGGITTANNSVLLTNGSGVPAWQTLLPLSLGGTNANLTASNGGIFYSTASAGAILSGTATANRILLSGSSAAPSWSTATYPSTTTVSQLLYSSATNVVGGITTANSSVLLTDGSGVPAWQTLLPLSLGGTNANLTASNGGIFYSTASAGAILLGTATANRILLSGSSAAPSWSTATYPVTTTANQLLYSSATNVIGGITTANSSVLLTDGSGVPAWQTLLPLSLGGTNANLTASNGGIFYSTASAGAILSGTATANRILLSGSNAAPSWSTATYPSTTTVSQLLYSSATNVIGGITTANNSVLLTNGSGVPAWQTLTSNVVTSLTGTANQITVSASTGAVTISMPAAVTITTSVTAGNLSLTGNILQSNNTNGSISIAPNGSGNLLLMPSGSTGNVGIGSSTPHSLLQFGNVVTNRILTLFEANNSDYEYYGFGIQSSTLVYHVPTISDRHVFYCGTSSSANRELMRITATANGNTAAVGINKSSPAAALHVVGGVQNIGGEDSVIRAESSSNIIKLELSCTASGGHLYELRSRNNGMLDIVDRTAGAARFFINGTGEVGIGNTATYLLDVFGTARVQKLIGNAAAPTVSLGAAAGTSPSSTITGSELNGTFQLTTGTSATSGLIGTFTIAAMPSSTFGVVFLAASSTTANPALGIWAASTGTTTFTFNSTTALASSTTYKWNYHIMG